jgi:hypothetical protein
VTAVQYFSKITQFKKAKQQKKNKAISISFSFLFFSFFKKNNAKKKQSN